MADPNDLQIILLCKYIILNCKSIEVCHEGELVTIDYFAPAKGSSFEAFMDLVEKTRNSTGDEHSSAFSAILTTAHRTFAGGLCTAGCIPKALETGLCSQCMLLRNKFYVGNKSSIVRPPHVYRIQPQRYMKPSSYNARNWQYVVVLCDDMETSWKAVKLDKICRDFVNIQQMVRDKTKFISLWNRASENCKFNAYPYRIRISNTDTLSPIFDQREKIFGEDLKVILQKLPNISSLELDSCGDVTLFEESIDREKLLEIVSTESLNTSSIDEGVFHNRVTEDSRQTVANCRNEDISNKGAKTPPCLNLSSAPNLKINLRNVIFRQLVVLKLHKIHFESNFIAITSLPKLTTLSLHSCSGVTSNILDAFASSLQFTQLELIGLHEIDVEFLSNFIKRLSKSLLSLHLTVITLNKNILESISKCKRLQNLGLEFDSYVTANNFRSIGTLRLNSLSLLSKKNCLFSINLQNELFRNRTLSKVTYFSMNLNQKDLNNMDKLESVFKCFPNLKSFHIRFLEYCPVECLGFIASFLPQKSLEHVVINYAHPYKPVNFPQFDYYYSFAITKHEEVFVYMKTLPPLDGDGKLWYELVLHKNHKFNWNLISLPDNKLKMDILLTSVCDVIQNTIMLAGFQYLEILQKDDNTSTSVLIEDYFASNHD